MEILVIALLVLGGFWLAGKVLQIIFGPMVEEEAKELRDIADDLKKLLGNDERDDEDE
jgi:phosphotransferase system IIB component